MTLRMKLFAVAAFAAGLSMMVTSPLRAADPPAPAVKDSRLAFRSKSLTFTTAVDPREARPGDTVTFKVTAKLKPGFHVYKYGKEQGAGPINTTFDFFDTAGLKVEGDWTASKEPEKHKDPNFADVDMVEYHEDEVTWSTRVKIPADTSPGKKVLRCQARYQVCDAKQCSIPGQWTLPDAELTVLSAKNEDSPKLAAAAAGAVEKKPAGTASSAPGAGAASSEKPAAPTTSSAADAKAPAASTGATARTEQTTGEKPQQPTAVASASASGAATADSASSPKGAFKSEIAEKAQQGLIPFLLASALGGLFALVMPCVWPMVPITVNFFVKQGQAKEGKNNATALAITYCLSIIGVFTAVGVLFSFFFSASSLQTFANNPWLNLGVAGLFLAFGLSLLGLFELRLPNFLLNASAQGESKGGLIGVIFMALTLTITSFTCTFPVVGGLLVMAAGGDFFYPIIGLATFATVIALPFFLLALSPNLISKMPRSGDWMNAVKVVGGLVEIGAAIKFVNTAELAWVTPENAWFDAQVVLTSWVVLAAVCGIYLLGLFRTDHDHDDVKVGPGRLVFGCLFLALALFMAPALFGRPPASLVWDRLIVGILPPDSGELSAKFWQCGRRSRRGHAPGSESHLERPGRGRAPGEESARRSLGDELRAGPRGSNRPETANPDRFHGRQLRQLPADGAPGFAARRCHCQAQEIHHHPALHRLRSDQFDHGRSASEARRDQPGPDRRPRQGSDESVLRGPFTKR